VDGKKKKKKEGGGKRREEERWVVVFFLGGVLVVFFFFFFFLEFWGVVCLVNCDLYIHHHLQQQHHVWLQRVQKLSHCSTILLLTLLLCNGRRK